MDAFTTTFIVHIRDAVRRVDSYEGLPRVGRLGYDSDVLNNLFALPAMPVPAKDDEGLLRLVAQGNHSALKRLYDRHSGRTMAVALRVLNNRAEAEEVIQDCFLQVWRAAGNYDERRGKVASWITAIARNRAIDRLRSRGAAHRMTDAAKKEADVQAKGAPSPLEDLEKKQTRESIRTALAALPDEQRQAVELAYFGGLTHAEIATRTGDPLGTVKGRIRSAIDKLGGLLAPPPRGATS